MNDDRNSFIRPEDVEGDNVLSKYYRIYLQLKKELYFGDYREGDRFFSLRELRGRYNVHARTVRAAIELLEQEGFLVNRPKSGTYVNDPLQRKPGFSMGNIWFSLLGPQVESPYYSAVIRNLQRQANLKGLNLIINWNPDVAEFDNWFRPETGDGLAVTGTLTKAFVNRLRGIDGLRYVVVGNYDLPGDVPMIHTQIRGAVVKAMALASGAGRRRLAVILGHEHLRATQDTLEGIKDASDAGLIEHVASRFAVPEDGYLGMKALKDADFDCVLVTESAFFGLCRHVFENGIKVPDDLFIIRFGKNEGYDIYEDVAAVNMVSDKTEMARKALDILFVNAEGPSEMDIDVLENPLLTSGRGQV